GRKLARQADRVRGPSLRAGGRRGGKRQIAACRATNVAAEVWWSGRSTWPILYRPSHRLPRLGANCSAGFRATALVPEARRRFTCQTPSRAVALRPSKTRPAQYGILAGKLFGFRPYPRQWCAVADLCFAFASTTVPTPRTGARTFPCTTRMAWLSRAPDEHP